MSWIKNKYGEVVEGYKEDRAASAITKKKAKAEYYRAREEQQLLLARKKAILESQKRERQLKAKYAPKPKPKPTSQITSNGFQMSWEPSGINSPSYFKPTKKKKKKKGDSLW